MFTYMSYVHWQVRRCRPSTLLRGMCRAVSLMSASWQQIFDAPSIMDRTFLSVATPETNRLAVRELLLLVDGWIIHRLLQFNVSTLVTVLVLVSISSWVSVDDSMVLWELRLLLVIWVCNVGESLTRLLCDACTAAHCMLADDLVATVSMWRVLLPLRQLAVITGSLLLEWDVRRLPDFGLTVDVVAYDMVLVISMVISMLCLTWVNIVRIPVPPVPWFLRCASMGRELPFRCNKENWRIVTLEINLM